MNIQERIVTASKRYQRIPESVQLLAVSKRHSAQAIAEASKAGQVHFGENFVSEALTKQSELEPLFNNNSKINRELVWHFIGKIQSNKARLVAQHFSWVHSLDREKIARRLNEFRRFGPPLNVLVQINLSDDPKRAGIQPSEATDFISAISSYDRLRVRGLMAMAPATDCFDTQSAAFARVKALLEDVRKKDAGIDQLSMGMSGDLEAAIKNGATWVRIGTDVFGKRPTD